MSPPNLSCYRVSPFLHSLDFNSLSPPVMNPSRSGLRPSTSHTFATSFQATLDSFRRIGANGKKWIGSTSCKKELSSRKPGFSRRLSRAQAGTTASLGFVKTFVDGHELDVFVDGHELDVFVDGHELDVFRKLVSEDVWSKLKRCIGQIQRFFLTTSLSTTHPSDCPTPSSKAHLCVFTSLDFAEDLYQHVVFSGLIPTGGFHIKHDNSLGDFSGFLQATYQTCIPSVQVALLPPLHDQLDSRDAQLYKCLIQPELQGDVFNVAEPELELEGHRLVGFWGNSSHGGASSC
ncbi:hypothetical protein K435DRAFT_869832 [Dendrothele bispora CBS 962.96]|uniref:Uncharacterized protein n=1 Tax=Dendrothele bispora (strain CBS 962.96) TaxID=1314807 RepID=A0A4S8L9I2_DENBC|nr:hypothetical protein K435DRAFT_869832 [Dendrothele bispora CBS 962.96]